MPHAECQTVFDRPIAELASKSPRTLAGALWLSPLLTWEMIQIYAHALINLLDNLTVLQLEARCWAPSSFSSTTENKITSILASAHEGCTLLGFESALKQLRTIQWRIAQGDCISTEFSDLVIQLRTRIREDMEGTVFYCIQDHMKIRQFYTLEDPQMVAQGDVPGLVLKGPEQVFDREIIQRWPVLSEDAELACRCFVFDLFTGCAFHLMRMVELGIIAVARIVHIEDPKASWGKLLDKMAQYAFRTKYEELPEAVKPHIQLIRELLPEMQAIQRAWRNSKVMHIEQKLIPTGTITEGMAREMLVAVNAFMRHLAVSLPDPRSAAPFAGQP